jgi:hypothetical protein
VNGALWLLIRLQLRGWLRYFLRGLLTLRGALLATLGGTFFLLWVLSVLTANTARGGVSTQAVQRTGPGFLLFYCFLNVMLSSGERGIYFTPAEVNLLFPAPISRRSLLGYKVVSSLILSVPSSLILSALSYGYATSFLAAFLGMMSIVIFMQLFTMALNLIAVSAGAALYARGRKLILAGALALAALVVWEAGDHSGGRHVDDLFTEAVNSNVWKVVTFPLTFFFDTFTAARVWPDLVFSTSMGLLVNVALLGVVFALDAHYMEASAAASARVYTRIKHIRSRTGGSATLAGLRFALPMPPSLGGIGTLCWRQLTTTVRMPGRLLVLLWMFVAIVAASQTMNSPRETGVPLAAVAGMIVLFVPVLLTTMLPFDFRGDVDRLALLKTLPVPPWRLALGQVLAPVIVLTSVQWLVLLALYVWGGMTGGPRQSWTGWSATTYLLYGLFAPPLNALLFGLENLMFLLFPTRIVANNPADFQAMGRTVLFMLAKLFVLGVVFGIVVLVGIDVGMFFPILGVVMAWLTLAFFASPLLPLIGWAFSIFDVGRDTPA